MNRATVVLLTAVAACVPDRPDAESAPAISIERMPLPALGASGPELRRSAVAVSADGHVAFTTGYHEGPELVTITDSTGRVVTRVGPEGGGPGELRGAYYLFFRDDVLHVADAFEGRLVRFGPDGSYHGYVAFSRALIPVGYVDDSLDVTDYSRLTGPRILRRALADTGYRELVHQGDTLFQRLIEVSRPNPTAFLVGIGSTRTGTLFGDGRTYELFAQGEDGPPSRFGRHLPLRLSDSHPPDTLTYFGLYSFGLDPRDRAWIVGAEDESGFIDVYERGTLVHHQPIDCNPNPSHAMSITYPWIAVLCKAAEEDPVEVTLRLYRIRS